MADRPLPFWLALVDRLVEERFSAALDEHGVTRTQWRLLATLATGPATGAELDREVAAMAASPEGETGAEELGELIESGWVTVGATYEITERGAAAYDRLADVVDGLRETLTEGLTDEEQSTVAVALDRMARNLGWNG
jgi:DNA-binding MarR family transcriptional regulator